MEVYSVNYSQIKKRINSKNNKFSFKFFIIFLIIIVFIGIFTAIKPLKTKNIKFFYVEINSFLNYKEANKLANSVQEQGGAGYIYYDGKYHVLTSLYLKKEDANKVKENLTKDFPTCKILTLEGNLFQRNYNKFQNEIIMNTINLNQNLIKNLYNLSVEIDINQSLNYTTKFDRIKDEYISKTKDFFKSFKLNKFPTQVESMEEILSSLDEILKWKNFCVLKYELINISICQINFLNSF